MVELLPSPAEAIRKPLESVVGNVLAREAPAPPWIAVDDGGGAWLGLAAARPAAERAHGVVAAAGDEALVAALQMGIGGAVRLPPSTLSLEEALSAAAASVVGGDACRPDLVAPVAAAGGKVKLLSFRNHAFWRNQLGETALASLLVELAALLEVPPAILPWPALLVAGREQRRVAAAWKKQAAAGPSPTQGLVTTTLSRVAEGPIAAAYRVLLEGEGVGGPSRPVPPESVHELPSGRLVGWWAPEPTKMSAEGWLATPVSVTASRCRWGLRSADRTMVVEEALTTTEFQKAGKTVAIRVPGWATRDLRPGTPAGLLVARLAESAARSGLPLWIPNLRTGALHFVLRLPGTLWVDGPAVPR